MGWKGASGGTFEQKCVTFKEGQTSSLKVRDLPSGIPAQEGMGVLWIKEL